MLPLQAWMNDEEFETSRDTEEGPGEKLIFTIGKRLAIPGKISSVIFKFKRTSNVSFNEYISYFC